jgi:hypothetical protein
MKPLALVLALSLVANGIFAVREHRAARAQSDAGGPLFSSNTSAATTANATSSADQ